MKTLFEKIMKADYSDAPDKHKQIISWMDKAEVIHIQNVADYFYRINDKEMWWLDDFPNLAPPFPAFWMEFVMPDTVNANGEILINKATNGYKFGFLFMNRKLDQEAHMWSLNILMFTENKKGEIHQNVGYVIVIDKTGRVSISLEGKHLFWINVSDEWMKNNSTMKDQINNFSNYIWAPLLALSFLHCKNVEMVAHDPNKIPGKRQKRNQSKIRYHVLHIEPMKKILRDEGQSETTGIKRALHICRGHFKDFSKGKGLFGRYQGLYWWDSQVRGNAKHGIVNKDYEVDQPAA